MAQQEARLVTPSAAAVKQRALSSAALVTLRGLAIRLLGFGSTIVVARYIAPTDFGVFTLGTAVLTAATFFTDAGMGAALIRQADEPERADLAAVQGFQLLVSGLIAVVVWGVGAFLGREGLVVAIMAVSLPITTLRVPALAMLERHLEYAPVVSVEIAQTLAYTVFLIGALAAGAGIWALPCSLVVQAVVGTLIIVHVTPVGVVAPRLDIARIRPVFKFGAQFQGIAAVQVANDQVFNASVPAIAGFGALGLWGMTYRLLQLPQLVFMSLRRVSYPAMARLIASGAELRATVERSARVAAVASGLVLAPLVAAAPAFVPVVFGERWSEAADILPGACLGLVIGGPVSVAVAAYLLAAGNAGTVLRSAILRVTALLALSLGLLPIIGVVAIGIGYLAGAIVEAAILGAATRRNLGVHLFAALVPGCLTTIVSGALGWFVAKQGGATAVSACAAASVTVVSFVMLSVAFNRDNLMDVGSLARRLVSLRSAGRESFESVS